MALVKYGGGVVQMSGSIAGDTHARNRYGNYIRARTKPINPNTANQQTVRTALTQLTARWAQVLTANQRTAWNLYAANVVMNNKLGESINLTGFNHYIRSNVILLMENRTIVDDGPVIFEIPEADPLLSVTVSEATQIYTVTFDATLPWANEDPGWLWLFQGIPQNAQRNFFAGPWRLFGSVVGILGGGVVMPQAIAADFAVAETQRLWIYARIQRVDGRISAPFRADCFCAA